MNNDLERAKNTMKTGKYTCVLCCGDKIVTSMEHGVKPLLEWISEDRDFTLFSASDKVVGKAAAFLYIILGIKEIYAEIISSGAKDIFYKHGIEVSYNILTDFIKNRSGTGFCPMEQAVMDVCDAEKAFYVIKKKALKLNIYGN